MVSRLVVTPMLVRDRRPSNKAVAAHGVIARLCGMRIFRKLAGPGRLDWPGTPSVGEVPSNCHKIVFGEVARPIGNQKVLLPEHKRRIAPVGIILANPQLVLARPKFRRVKMHDQDGGTIALHDSLSGRSQERVSLPITIDFKLIQARLTSERQRHRNEHDAARQDKWGRINRGLMWTPEYWPVLKVERSGEFLRSR